MRLLGVLLAVVCSPALLWACTCMNPSGLSDARYLKQLNSTSAIVEAEVVAVGERVEEKRKIGRSVIPYAYRMLELKVLNVWKGVDTPTLQVEAEAWSSCAAPTVKPGEKLMLYLYRGTSQALQMSYCSINGWDHTRTERMLGSRKKIESTPSR